MNNKKIPMRSCVVTREKLPKKELVRVVRTPFGEVVIDTTGKVNGRGAYLKKDAAVFERARVSKVLDKVLEIEVPENIFDELMNTIK